MDNFLSADGNNPQPVGDASLPACPQNGSGKDGRELVAAAVQSLRLASPSPRAAYRASAKFAEPHWPACHSAASNERRGANPIPKTASQGESGPFCWSGRDDSSAVNHGSDALGYGMHPNGLSRRLEQIAAHESE
ncbi:MAG: hypothetical protein N2255_00585, partial [Kiritimatiellae bacterium]|nr:hypothetical protein [Kiritimatiellia bacterium]